MLKNLLTSHRRTVPSWKPLPCPYCIVTSMMHPSSAEQHQGDMTPRYKCPTCESAFELDSNGDLEAIIPTNTIQTCTDTNSSFNTPTKKGNNAAKSSDFDVPKSPRYCTPLPLTTRTPLRWEDPSGLGLPLLCRRCQTNQTIITNLLAACDDIDDKFVLYRTDLENRYPLCEECKHKVDLRLQELDGVVRSQRKGPTLKFAPGSRSSGGGPFTFFKRFTSKTKTKKRSQKTALFDIFASITLAFTKMIINFAPAPALASLTQYTTLHVILGCIISFLAFTFTNHSILSFILLLLRSHYILVEKEPLIVLGGILATHYIQIDQIFSTNIKNDDCDFDDFDNNNNSGLLSRPPIHQNPLQPPHQSQQRQHQQQQQRILKEEPESPLRSLSGLDSLGPQTPLTTRYADLKKRKSAFAQLKPSTIAYSDRTSGLEDVLNNFSLNSGLNASGGYIGGTGVATAGGTATATNNNQSSNHKTNGGRIALALLLSAARLALPSLLKLNEKVVIPSLLMVPFLVLHDANMIMKVVSVVRIAVLLSDGPLNGGGDIAGSLLIQLFWTCWDSLNIVGNVLL